MCRAEARFTLRGINDPLIGMESTQFLTVIIPCSTKGFLPVESIGHECPKLSSAYRAANCLGQRLQPIHRQGMTSQILPSHVAVIMDGNRRWARKRMLPIALGHANGAKAIRGTVRACSDRGVKYLTLFAFSTENWKRPAEEVSSLMRLLMLYLQKEVADMNANGVRLQIIGDTSRFDIRLQALIAQAHALTANNTRIRLNVAVNYGGKWDMLQAVKAWQVANPNLPISAMDESGLQAHLCMADMPDPCLLIRTGGEARISNFLLWQMAYTELFFTNTLWPDFDSHCLDEALRSYAGRDRRFGTSGGKTVDAESPADAPKTTTHDSRVALLQAK